MCVGSENNLRYYSLVTDHLCLETWSPRGLELTHKVGWVSRPVSLGSTWLCLPRVGITGMQYHAQPFLSGLQKRTSSCLQGKYFIN